MQRSIHRRKSSLLRLYRAAPAPRRPNVERGAPCRGRGGGIGFPGSPPPVKPWRRACIWDCVSDSGRKRATINAPSTPIRRKVIIMPRTPARAPIPSKKPVFRNTLAMAAPVTKPTAPDIMREPNEACGCAAGRGAGMACEAVGRVGADCAGFERWKDWAGAGAVFVRGETLSVRAPRLPELDPLPARASASAGAKARTRAVSTASGRPLLSALPDVIVVFACENMSHPSISFAGSPGKRYSDLRLPLV